MIRVHMHLVLSSTLISVMYGRIQYRISNNTETGLSFRIWLYRRVSLLPRHVISLEVFLKEWTNLKVALHTHLFILSLKLT